VIGGIISAVLLGPPDTTPNLCSNTHRSTGYWTCTKSCGH